MRCRPPLDFDDEFGDCGAELVLGSPIPGFAIQLFFHSAKFAVSLIGARRGRRADGVASMEIIQCSALHEARLAYSGIVVTR
jgi:hypothetical protein